MELQSGQSSIATTQIGGRGQGGGGAPSGGGGGAQVIGVVSGHAGTGGQAGVCANTVEIIANKTTYIMIYKIKYLDKNVFLIFPLIFVPQQCLSCIDKFNFNY